MTNLVALGATAASAVVATIVVRLCRPRHRHLLQVMYYKWIPAGLGHVAGNFAEFRGRLGASGIDPLSAHDAAWSSPCVGFLIHVYSIGYMAHEDGLHALLRLPQPVHVHRC